MTIDERIEIAERLREATVDDGHLGRPYGEQVFQVTLHRIIGTSNPRRPTLYARLADLIDPTCNAEPMDAMGKPPFYNCILSSDEVVQGCSKCGYPFGNSSRGIGNPRGVPNYCPNCGARVVRDDGVE